MRGGAEQFIEETERSLHDAIMIVRRAIKNDSVVAGGSLLKLIAIIFHASCNFMVIFYASCNSWFIDIKCFI